MASALERRRLRLAARTAVLVLLLVGLIASAAVPAAAQDNSGSSATNPICQDSSNTLPDMIEGFVQITTALGLMGLLVVWQADSLMEMFTLSREQKANIKQHKRGAMRSAVVLVVLGPVFTVAGSTMGLPIAQCVDLIPF
ncbi:hypothetical protein [Haloglomus salinum]|uniref:hypothetical protein n=1 Tax=Haloglomus salinum TaxID=2962673 RepID=UPI0020C9AA7A|nr:hypothetical protein [Haloglomus salinum]